MKNIATIIFAAGILGLFALDRDKNEKTSKALWIPVMWLLIVGSRPVSQWLQMGPAVDSPAAVLDGSPIDAVAFGILMAAGLIVLVARQRRVRAFLKANSALLLFFFYCAASVFWSDYPFVAFKRWTKAVADVVMVIIVLTDLDRISAIKKFLARTGFLLVPLSILFIKYYPDIGRGYGQWDGVLYNNGVATNKNLLGLICLVIGLGTLWRFLVERAGQDGALRRRQLLAQGTLLAMVLWLLWIANSVTSLSCFALAGCLLLLFSVFDLARRRVVIHFLVGTLLSIASLALFLNAGSDVVQMMGRDPTLTGRTKIWSLVLSLSGNPLFGTGFESFWLGTRLQKVWNIYWFHLNEAHNGYLEVFLNLGWLGIAIFAVAIMMGYRDIVRSFQSDPDMARLRLTYFVTGMAYSLTEAGFRMMSPAWIFFLLALTSTRGIGLPAQSDPQEPVSCQQWPRPAVSVQTKAGIAVRPNGFQQEADPADKLILPLQLAKVQNSR